MLCNLRMMFGSGRKYLEKLPSYWFYLKFTCVYVFSVSSRRLSTLHLGPTEEASLRKNAAEDLKPLNTKKITNFFFLNHESFYL